MAQKPDTESSVAQGGQLFEELSFADQNVHINRSQPLLKTLGNSPGKGPF